MKTKLFCLGICFAIFLVGCSSGHRNYDTGKSSADSTAKSESKADTIIAGAKLVKTANINCKVKNVRHACEDVANLTSAYHGLVMHHVMQSSQERSYDNPMDNDSVMHVISYTATADMTVRIPSDRMEDFMNAVGKMAVYINTSNMDIQDKTLDYMAANLKAQNRSQVLAQEKGSITAKNADQAVALGDDLVAEKVNNRRIDQEVKYSTIGLTLYQDNSIIEQVVVSDDPSNFKLPVLKQLGNAMANGWFGFVEIVIALANVWVFFALGAMGWFVYRYIKRRQVVKTA